MLEQPLAQIKNMAFLSREDIEKISTAKIRNIYLGNNITLCKMLTKYKIYLDGRDAGVVPNILLDGFWESWITKFIAKMVQPGDYCIDAGANFGYYSLLLADLAGANGRTLALEPNLYLCQLLAMTNNINECHFEVINKAASNSSGETMLSIPDNFWGGGTIVEKAHTKGSSAKQNVKIDTMDNIVSEAGYPRVDFIKMDCEGAEPLIFDGMKNILEQNAQLKIAMEYSPFLYTEPEKFTEFLFSRFDVGEITGDSDVRKFADSDIPYLLNLNDHIDLFLSQKVIQDIQE